MKLQILTVTTHDEINVWIFLCNYFVLFESRVTQTDDDVNSISFKFSCFITEDQWIVKIISTTLCCSNLLNCSNVIIEFDFFCESLVFGEWRYVSDDADFPSIKTTDGFTTWSSHSGSFSEFIFAATTEKFSFLKNYAKTSTPRSKSRFPSVMASGFSTLVKSAAIW